MFPKDPTLITNPTACHYEESLPNDSAEFRECEKLAEATLARVNKMQMEAAMKGLWLSLGRTSEGMKFEGAEKHFQGIELPEKKDLPRIKVSQLQKLELHHSEND